MIVRMWVSHHPFPFNDWLVSVEVDGFRFLHCEPVNKGCLLHPFVKTLVLEPEKLTMFHVQTTPDEPFGNALFEFAEKLCAECNYWSASKKKRYMKDLRAIF